MADLAKRAARRMAQTAAHRNPIGRAGVTSDLKAALAIGAATLLVMLPALLSQPILHQSFWISWVWADQFTAELAAGNLYPRWLPDSHGGLGSPVFYYYPPGAFYVTGLFGLAGLSTYGSILAAFAVAFAASGVAMYRWLREWTAYPLAGALFFMVAPYHVIDFYGRGALAETLAIGFIPVIALGMKHGRSILVALAYAGLILTHLPLAVLAGPFLVAPYAFYLARTDWRHLVRLLLPLLVGTLIACVYLAPALLLDRYRDASHLSDQPFLHPSFWSVFTFEWARLTYFHTLVYLAILTIAVAGLVLFLLRRSVWAGWATAACAIVAGFLPGFWSLPIIEQVQFAFRAKPFAEFAAATALATTHRLLTGAIAIVPALLITAFTPISRQSAPSLSHLQARHPDVREYLPPGVSQPSWGGIADFVVADHYPGKLSFPDSTRERRIGSALSLLGLIWLLLLWRSRRARVAPSRPTLS